MPKLAPDAEREKERRRPGLGAKTGVVRIKRTRGQPKKRVRDYIPKVP